MSHILRVGTCVDVCNNQQGVAVVVMSTCCNIMLIIDHEHVLFRDSYKLNLEEMVCLHFAESFAGRFHFLAHTLTQRMFSFYLNVSLYTRGV